MQKIIIKNFGPIQDAEIELKKVLVLIGEQASGKSTIARLIYFFKTLRQDLVYQIYKNESELFNYQDHLVLLIKEKFHHFFGLSLHKTSFNIRFYYSIEKNKYINVSLDEHNKLKVIVSNIFLNDDFSEKLNDLIPQINYLEANDDGILTAKYLDNIFKLINQLFEDKIRYSLFVIAGRNVTVNYSDLFEKRQMLRKTSPIKDQKSYRRVVDIKMKNNELCERIYRKAGPQTKKKYDQKIYELRSYLQNMDY